MIKLLLGLAVIWLVWRYWPRSRPRQRIVTDAAEARAILGVPPGAGAEVIRAAHRRLVRGVHPDRGGSAELARRVNAARDVLLKD